MAGKSNSKYIVFGNLVQVDIEGKSRPVKVPKAPLNDTPYAQSNAAGELYRPENLEVVASRADSAGEQFLNRFKKRK